MKNRKWKFRIEWYNWDAEHRTTEAPTETYETEEECGFAMDSRFVSDIRKLQRNSESVRNVNVTLNSFEKKVVEFEYKLPLIELWEGVSCTYSMYNPITNRGR